MQVIEPPNSKGDKHPKQIVIERVFFGFGMPLNVVANILMPGKQVLFHQKLLELKQWVPGLIPVMQLPAAALGLYSGFSRLPGHAQRVLVWWITRHLHFDLRARAYRPPHRPTI